VNARDGEQVPPLIYAVYGDARIVRLLIRRGANVHLQMDEGGTALNIARMLLQEIRDSQRPNSDWEKNYLQTIRALKDAGAKE
jgi:hypothetical protein